MVFGYARVSAKDQNDARQMAALWRSGQIGLNELAVRWGVSRSTAYSFVR